MSRLKPDDRKLQILRAALVVASKDGGLSTLSRQSVAAEAGCAESLVSRYFGTMIEFKRTIMRAAVHNQILPVIAQGLAMGDKHAQKADPELKSKALATLQ